MYTASEKECLAVVLRITKFRHFLEGKAFTIVTDHHALCALPKANFKSTRLQNWAVMLSQLNYHVEYSTEKHHPPDCLSRYQSEWNHRKMIEEDELMDSYLRTLSKMTGETGKSIDSEGDDGVDMEDYEHIDDGGMQAVLEDHIKKKFGFPYYWSIRYLRCRYNN